MADPAKASSAPAPASKDSADRGLRIAHVTVRYFGRDASALRDVSVGVPAGSIVGVTGPNGAGKSTLALAAAGFIPRIVRARLEGSVTSDGESVIHDELDEGSRVHRVGIVFANPDNQLSATKVTVREELAFGLENLGVARPEMERRIDDVLERLRIGHLADRSPFALSGGEQQRVAIASIVAMGMSAMVLDEPTAQLDPRSTATVGDVLDSLAREGTAILVAEHAATILGRVDRCLVLDDGQVAAFDVPGRALSSQTLGPIGLEPPTLVALAEAAGVPPERAFDEEAIASAIARSDRIGAAPGSGATTVPAFEWRPVRNQPPAPILIRGLVHRYPNGVEAVRGVDLAIEPGEAVAIVGQNGSGKTTLVKHLNGLLRAGEGTVAVGGADAAQVPVHRLASTVGFVFQNPDDQLFNRSVEREVRFGPRNLRLPPADQDRLVEQALDAVGLAGLRSANPYDLNVSSRKLVALASILAMDPAVLVLDEPTTGQDGPGVRHVGAIVDAARAAGRTVVAITHDMEFAARHFGRIIVMRLGEVVADGPPDAIFAADRVELLASTGLTPPPAARVAAALGLPGAPADTAGLLRLLALPGANAGRAS